MPPIPSQPGPPPVPVKPGDELVLAAREGDIVSLNSLIATGTNVVRIRHILPHLATYGVVAYSFYQ